MHLVSIIHINNTQGSKKAKTSAINVNATSANNYAHKCQNKIS